MRAKPPPPPAEEKRENGVNVVYYVEAVTTKYHNQKLLVNKQMIKTGFDEIPNLHGLIDAINKKEGESQYLADLKQIRKAYALDVKEIYPNNSIPQNSEKSTPTAKKSHAFSEEETKEIQNSFANAKKIGSLILGSLPKSNVARIYTQPIKHSISDFLNSVKTLPLTNEVFSADVAQELLGEAAVEDSNGNLEYHAVRFVVTERINQPLYLYDIIDIKKETSSSLSQSWITKMDKNSSRSLNNSISQNPEKSTPTAKKVPLSAKRRQICFSKQWKTVG